MRANVHVLPAEQRDKYGDGAPPPGAGDAVLDCILAPIPPSTEVAERGREGAVEYLTCYAPAGTRLEHEQLVAVDDGPYEGRYTVEGRPNVWENPWVGPEDGVEIVLRKAEG